MRYDPDVDWVSDPDVDNDEDAPPPHLCEAEWSPAMGSDEEEDE